MRTGDFTNQSPGRLVRSLDGSHLAFDPDPLPPSLEFGQSTQELIIAASDAIGELRGVGRTLPNPSLVVRPFARREAVLSSRIEGTTASEEDLILFDAGARDVLAEPDEAREVSNYLSSLSFGLDRIKQLPICNRLIREIHAVLMQGVRGQDRRPGEFRAFQNMISGIGADPRFVPPPASEMRRAMDELERYIGSAPNWPPVLVQVALVHYQFETIHPFMDGNGRMGRLLIPLMLHERGVLPQPLLYLSAYLDQHKDRYRDLLLRVSQTGDWAAWVDFFLVGVVEQGREAVVITQRLRDLRETYRQQTTGPRIPSNVQAVIDMLFERPAVTATEVRDRLAVTSRTAYQLIERLAEAGIVREATGGTYRRVYLAHGVVRATSVDRAPAPGAGA